MIIGLKEVRVSSTQSFYEISFIVTPSGHLARSRKINPPPPIFRLYPRLNVKDSVIVLYCKSML